MFNKKCKMKIKQSTGITLVALVVTIVVLLILAGITINLILGPNSIFNNAKESKDKTETGTFEERLGMVYTDAMIKRGQNGKLTPEEYFEILKNYEIISDLKVPGGNIAEPTENEDGSKTYRITSDDDYIFEVTIYPDGKVETEVIGKDGNVEAKVKSILVTNKTKDSISIRVLARTQGGTVKAYYKLMDDVVTNEAEDSIDGYTEITLNENLEGTLSGLTEGKEYKIKAVLKKDGKDIGWVSNEIKISALVTSVTLNKPTTTIEVEKSETLIATVKPDNAEKKEIEWTTSSESVAKVDQTGKVTGVAVGTATITATNTESGKSAICTVVVESNWTEIAKWAEYIATHESEVSGEETNKKAKRFDEDKNPLYIGQTFKVDYGGNLVDVEIIDFLHDDLADGVRYDSDASKTKAGITFDFKDCIGRGIMNTDITSAGGWGNSYMRKKTGIPPSIDHLTIPDIRENLSANLKNVIKRVKKGTYKYEAKTKIDFTEDDLWLLSEWEVFGAKTYSIGKEGEQYAYYKTASKRIKLYGGSTIWSWLRSPREADDDYFCCVRYAGAGYVDWTNGNDGVCPGFCI